jgi:hypothetical protein
MGTMMNLFLRLWGGRQVYVERDQWSSMGRFIEWRFQEREMLLWIGPWHAIYTPARSQNDPSRPPTR